MDISYFPMGVSAQSFMPIGNTTPLLLKQQGVFSPHFEVLLEAKKGTETFPGFSS